jgi:serine protease
MIRLSTKGGVRLRAFVGSLAFGLVMLAPLAASAVEPGGFTDRIIVKYRGSGAVGATTASAAAAAADAQLRGTDVAAARLGVQLSRLHATALGSQVLKVDRRLSIAEATQLAHDIAASDPSVEYAEPDRLMHALLTPNDTRYNEQWHYFESTAGIDAPGAWDKATGSGVVVGIVDTGYRPHADLSGQILQGYDFISDTFVSQDGDGRDSDASDPGDWMNAGECGGGEPAQFESSSWHGTHVAGTIAAKTNNASGVAGIAFNAKIVPARVLGKCGGYTSDIADAIIWVSGGSVSGVPANANPVKVINISLGGIGSCDTTTQNAINSARSRGANIIVAAGNENHNASQDTPANCSGVVTVASVNRSGGRSYFSNFGTSVEVAAPGGDMRTSASNGILSTLNTGTTTPGSDTYAFYQGTSMATPHVVGVVALMLSAKPTLTPDQVLSILQSTARPFPATCSQCGSGIVDALAAVNAAIGGSTPPPGTNEVEPNNSRSAAQAIGTANTTVNGTLSSSSDTDYYSVSLPAGRTLTATLTPNTSSDYDLYIYNSSGTLIARSERGTGLVDSASVTNTGTGAIARYVRVVYFAGGTGSTNGKYTLNLNW